MVGRSATSWVPGVDPTGTKCDIVVEKMCRGFHQGIWMGTLFYYMSAAMVGGGFGTSGIFGQVFLWSGLILIAASFAFREED